MDIIKKPSFLIFLVSLVLMCILFLCGNPIIFDGFCWHHIPEWSAIFCLSWWLYEIRESSNGCLHEAISYKIVLLAFILLLLLGFAKSGLSGFLSNFIVAIPLPLGYLAAKHYYTLKSKK